MDTSSQFLPPEIDAAVEAQHGGPVSAPGQHGKYIVMYGGVLEATPEKLADSVAAIKRSLAQAAAGQTRDADEAFDELFAENVAAVQASIHDFKAGERGTIAGEHSA